MYVEPGASSDGISHSHAGEEVGYILSGQLRYWVDNESYDLEPGDAINFESTRPHRYENPGTETSVSLWVLTPPSF
ncbi:cupin domain-containing protein [Kibdelosporangium lantanae]|uniref:Cupin domain-containing protein n=1 Tax=Kibdelosporangium lantanae TaxID=1497396 RepID=A0ABW3MQZ0_9PSEU